LPFYPAGDAALPAKARTRRFGESSKPPNLRHLWAILDFGKCGRKKSEKGVGFERKMIYLGRHKSWVLWGRNIEQF
jgi:hypothetical protein